MQQKPTGTRAIAGISKSVATSSILLLRPKENMDTDKTAQRLALCDGVQEVSLSSGEFGFVVSAKHRGIDGIEHVKRSIRSALKSADIVTLTKHYVYSKQRSMRRHR